VTEATTVEVNESRSTQVGSVPVRRALPTRGRRTVGPWCFLDHMGPTRDSAGGGIEVPPHPHIGLQTVTWLFEGSALHRDSLGSEQLIRPGQLNLMTAGAGVAHSEEDPDGSGDRIHGMQLWVALPERTRWGGSAFEHHDDLPRVDVGHGTCTVLVGSFVGVRSPARTDSDLMGVELDLVPGTTVLPLDPAYEHAIVMAEGIPEIDGTPVSPGRLAYLAPGADELELTSPTPTVALLIGGVPFDEEVLMWWNFVARTREELAEAYRDWSTGAERFGAVASELDRVTVGPPPWVRGA
jgi:quercetin 2,3-dioxygenase